MAYINLLDIIYPIGTIYLSSSAESPAEKFGGAWSERTSGEVLRAAHTWSSTGQDNHTLSVNQMPNHNHTVSAVYTNYIGSTRNGSGIPPHDGAPTSGNWLVNCGYTGGGQAFSKLPKCLNLYCWERTA